MNRLLLLGLIGGAAYWLLREPPQDAGEDYEGGYDFEDALAGGGLDPENEQDLLDDALADSFPASDPPSMTTHPRP